MLCSFDELKSALEVNEEIEFFKDVPCPSCPKNADVVCAKSAGNCPIGNKKDCEQVLKFYYKETSIYMLTVMFVAKENSRIGYVRDTDLQVRRMISKKIISQSDLKQVV